jgi:hypothetical protein
MYLRGTSVLGRNVHLEIKDAGNRSLRNRFAGNRSLGNNCTENRSLGENVQGTYT